MTLFDATALPALPAAATVPVSIPGPGTATPIPGRPRQASRRHRAGGGISFVIGARLALPARG
jgi:hypothetical protein